MDYSLLLGVHYRAPQNLRTQASFNHTIVPDRLAVLSEEGNFVLIHLTVLHYLSL
jgi:1-phosphatidylinositol-4-phosphate 5-kinase